VAELFCLKRALCGLALGGASICDGLKLECRGLLANAGLACAEVGIRFLVGGGGGAAFVRFPLLTTASAAGVLRGVSR